MKLIELLVQELPKRGGWPDGVKAIEQSVRGYLFDSLHPSAPFLFDRHGFELTDEWRTEIVTREQYEAALAASKKVEWDGEDLPPLGCECEVKRVAEWMPVTIVFISERHTIFRTSGGTEDCYQTCSLQFRPIRSEADKKREDVSEQIAIQVCNHHGYDECNSDTFLPLAEYLYDKIAAGEIHHIRIE